MPKKTTLSQALFIRLSPSDAQRIASVQAVVPLLKKAALARVALRIGLARIEERPEIVLQADQENVRRKRPS